MMKKLRLLLLTLAMLPLATMADALRDSVPSNYGGWLNLTNGYTEDHNENNQKMDVAIDGQTIHLLWCEMTKRAANEYGVWYRRSTDLGKTWEKARMVATVRTDDVYRGAAGAAKRLMAVSGGNVHIVLINNHTWDTKETQGLSHLLYLRSTDGGNSFTTAKLGLFDSDYYSYRAAQIAADGNLVVIGASKRNDNELYFFTSKDGGGSFSEQMQKIDSRDSHYFLDLQASGSHWAAMVWAGYWYSGLRNGDIRILTSDGSSITTKSIAPVCKYGDKEVPFANSDVMSGGNGESYNYHPQMVMDGQTIHVMYQGNPGLEEVTGGWNYDFTLYQKSTDGGQTWSKAQWLPESKGSHGMIAAKGQNVYILTTKNSYHLLYYSNDGGQTWSTQQQSLIASGKDADRYNPCRDYWIAIDPTDATGSHTILTGNRFFYAETKDGFKTLSRNFAIGSETWQGFYRSNNHALRVVFDNNGLQHWFLQYQMPVLVPSGSSYYVDGSGKLASRDICYRRVEPEPAPSGQNMALSLEDEYAPQHRVVVPMSASLNLKKAMTVEFWVKPDVVETWQLASCTNSSATQEGSKYQGGWFIQLQADRAGYQYIYAGLTTEKATDGNGVQINVNGDFRYYLWKKSRWHHVAITYDSSVEKDNFRLYVDGVLTGTETGYGDILQGNNPICLGRNNGFGKSEGLMDNFAIWSRALSAEEIHDHIHNTRDGKDADCRLLLTFDGTLKDQSQYGNDAVALLDAELTAHNGIHPPKADFDYAKDLTGLKLSLIDKSENGEAVYWLFEQKKAYYRYQTDTIRAPQFNIYQDGAHTLIMAACNDNAYAAVSKTVEAGSALQGVEPQQAAQAEGVRLKIIGNYKLDYWTQPKVILHGAGGDIEGKWPFEYGDRYNPSDLETADQLAQAVFDLSKAAVGKYDLILGKDTLKQAFEVVAKGSGEPDVWMQINGWSRSLFNKWKDFSIDYGNRSSVPAYNIPIYLYISDNKGMTDVSFDFDFQLCNYALEDFGLQVAKSLGEYTMVADANGDSLRCYSFMIPYIGPNSTNHKTFRIRHRSNEQGAGGDIITMHYAIDQPWGAYDPDANPYGSNTRAIRRLFTFEQGECIANYLLQGLAEEGIGQIPGVGCIYSAGKTVYQAATEKEKPWTTFFTNAVSTAFSCGMDVFPFSAAGRWCYWLSQTSWSLFTHYRDAKACVSGDPQKKEVKGVGSYDPNEMIGPAGYDDQRHYIKPIHNMAYTITYENKSTATAPAHEVYIHDRLDAACYDLGTFGFTSFGWANRQWSVGGSRTKEFTRDVKTEVNGKEITVRVTGKFDSQTGEASWSMVSLDGKGKPIEDPDLGFLVPNNGNQDGEGFVTFAVVHKHNPQNGSSVSNKATIIFDANAPIETNTYVNTFDTDYPTSRITKVEEQGGKLVLTIEGSDTTSGIASYDVYVFRNGGEAELASWQVTGDTYTLPYDANTSYAFCTVATDHVGWREAKDVKPEVEFVSSSIRDVTLDSQAGPWAVYSADGRRVAEGEGTMRLPLTPGIYVVRNGRGSRKVIVR